VAWGKFGDLRLRREYERDEHGSGGFGGNPERLGETIPGHHFRSPSRGGSVRAAL
jgi:hypothetical protein